MVITAVGIMASDGLYCDSKSSGFLLWTKKLGIIEDSSENGGEYRLCLCASSIFSLVEVKTTARSVPPGFCIYIAIKWENVSC